MWIKECRILSVLSLALFSLPALFSQSIRDEAISKLSDYQVRLQLTKQQIQTLQAQTLDLQNQITDLSQRLSSSEENCQMLSDELEASKALLEKSLADLRKQEAISTELSRGLEKLKSSWNLYRDAAIVLGSISVIFGGYALGHWAGYWK